MNVEDLELGDVVYAARLIVDDGSIPDGTEGEVLAEVGTRGVITLIGHVEEEPSRTVFLVRFEDKEMNLGNPVGCWVEDLMVEPKLVIPPTLQ
ncbi:MAG: nitrogen fixation protein NifZ [Methylococcales bacterium]|jgi:nitrogen fixation protein NifZ|nr:MAG: nitrogen fixation protein NifZ [Methylococcales bacterium]